VEPNLEFLGLVFLVKTFITPIAAALLLSSPAQPVLAESYSASLARLQLEKISRHLGLSGRALKVEDFDTACSEMRRVVLLTRFNLEGLEEAFPSEDWVETLQRYRDFEKSFCSGYFTPTAPRALPQPL
jgi:hypothetical protein